METIGDAHEKLRELERNGLLKERLEKLIANQEDRLSIKYARRPKIVVTMRVHNKPPYHNGRIILQYWNEEYLYHELGHFYLDILCGKMGIDLVTNNKEITEWWEARNKLIHEGIASYFEREMANKDRDDFDDCSYPKDIRSFLQNDFLFLRNLYYSGGYHLIKPILDKFGTEEGIKRIVAHLPRKQEMIRLPDYRESILSSYANCA